MMEQMKRPTELSAAIEYLRTSPDHNKLPLATRIAIVKVCDGIGYFSSLCAHQENELNRRDQRHAYNEDDGS